MKPQAGGTYVLFKDRKSPSAYHWKLLKEIIVKCSRCTWGCIAEPWFPLNAFNYFIITRDPGLVCEDRCVMNPFLAPPCKYRSLLVYRVSSTSSSREEGEAFAAAELLRTRFISPPCDGAGGRPCSCEHYSFSTALTELVWSSRPVRRKGDSCVSSGGISAFRNSGWEQLIKYLTQHTWN